MKLKQLGANMTELTLATGQRILFSYETPVATQTVFCVSGGIRVFQKTNKKWSRTTSKHITKYLNELRKERELHVEEVDQSVLDSLVGEVSDSE